MNVNQHEHAFTRPLDILQLANQVPAAFSDCAADTTSDNYVFISTKELVNALLDAGFIATQARQAKVRAGTNAAYARHLLRFQHARESVTLVDAIPQIVLINSHDGKCSYQLRAGLYRPVCTNGLLTRLGDFGLIHVPHRGNVVQNVVDGALALTRDFTKVGAVIERMAALQLDIEQRVQFANQALAVRYPHGQHPAGDRRTGLVPAPPGRLEHGPLAGLQRRARKRDARRHARALGNGADGSLARDPCDPRGRANQQRVVATGHRVAARLIDHRAGLHTRPCARCRDPNITGAST